LTRAPAIVWSLAAWLAVGVFWLTLTHSFHPTWTLAVITTSALVVAYATAFYINHLLLIPKYWRMGRYGVYLAALVATMAALTAAALAVIRTCYFAALGPDPDPNGLYVHYAIDFIGMSAHLLFAASIVWLVGKIYRFASSP
jgi:hypothetical protein